MRERRTAAMLGVLLVHVLFAWSFSASLVIEPFELPPAPGASLPVEMLDLREFREEPEAEVAVPALPPPVVRDPRIPAPSPPPEAADIGATAGVDEPRNPIDWSLQGRRSATRVLDQEREAERIARMFAGPDGTWASLTKRERSGFDHFKWRPGVDGLERDENGNTIYRVNDRCVLVNFLFIGCSLGAKPPAYGDLFKDMRQYFDEQRLPRTPEGNGTEPESKRPPKWSRPLPETTPGRYD